MPSSGHDPSPLQIQGQKGKGPSTGEIVPEAASERQASWENHAGLVAGGKPNRVVFTGRTESPAYRQGGAKRAGRRGSGRDGIDGVGER